MNHGRLTPIRPMAAGEAWRSYVDAEGTCWEVREMKSADYDRRAGTSLIFESIGAIRRVRNFPASWTTLSDAELEALSYQR